MPRERGAMNTYVVGILMAIGLFGFAGLSATVDWWRSADARTLKWLTESIPKTLLNFRVSGMTVRWFEYQVWPWNRHLVRRALRQLEANEVIVVSGEPTDDNRFVHLNPRYEVVCLLRDIIGRKKDGRWFNDDSEVVIYFDQLAQYDEEFALLLCRVAEVFRPGWQAKTLLFYFRDVPELAEFHRDLYNIYLQARPQPTPNQLPWNGGK